MRDEHDRFVTVPASWIVPRTCRVDFIRERRGLPGWFQDSVGRWWEPYWADYVRVPTDVPCWRIAKGGPPRSGGVAEVVSISEPVYSAFPWGEKDIA